MRQRPQEQVPRALHRVRKELDGFRHGLIDRFADQGGTDLVETFTRHFPFGIIYRQLALPDRLTTASVVSRAVGVPV